MAETPHWTVIPSDRDLLRALAARRAEIAQLPIMAERRRLWIKHAGLRGERPMILAETQGALPEVMPDRVLQCREPWARDVERVLRLAIYQHEEVGDDTVIEPWYSIKWQVDLGNYGPIIEKHRGDNAGKLGSYVWDPPVKDLDRDLDKIHPRRPTVDRAGTYAWKAHLESIFGDLLPVRIRGPLYWTMGLTWTAIDLLGLQPLMMAMYDNPAGLHRLMAFLRDDHIAISDWLEREGLYTLNNEDDYVGSGTVGYTDELPQRDWKPGDPVRPKDLWVLSESQETVGVSPRLFEQFVFQYQLPILSRFGLCYYGCCEPVHARWPIIKRIPNLRRVSISPWCDQRYMAEQMGDRYIFCRKPAPSMISTPAWDEDALRADLRETVEITGGRNLEIVMKDVHTMAEQPQRLGRWVQLAREESEK